MSFACPEQWAAEPASERRRLTDRTVSRCSSLTSRLRPSLCSMFFWRRAITYSSNSHPLSRASCSQAVRFVGLSFAIASNTFSNVGTSVASPHWRTGVLSSKSRDFKDLADRNNRILTSSLGCHGIEPPAEGELGELAAFFDEYGTKHTKHFRGTWVPRAESSRKPIIHP